jgi:hypothetical protein
VNVHYAIPHAYAGYMAKQMLKRRGIKFPMVTTLHGTDITLVGNHPFIKRQLLSVLTSDFVTSVSQSLKDDTLNYSTEEIQVILILLNWVKYIDQVFPVAIMKHRRMND